MTDAATLAVVMYTQALCGYCAAARSLLDKKNVAYQEIDVTFNASMRREVTSRTGVSTVPQIFFNDQFVGGYDDLVELDRAGRLNEMLGLTD